MKELNFRKIRPVHYLKLYLSFSLKSLIFAFQFTKVLPNFETALRNFAALQSQTVQWVSF